MSGRYGHIVRDGDTNGAGWVAGIKEMHFVPRGTNISVCGIAGLVGFRFEGPGGEACAKCLARQQEVKP